MNVLIACEFSGIVRDAFIRLGHDAISVDLEPSESSFGPHWQGDIFEFLDSTNMKFDMMIAHPPCTYLCNSGVRWISEDISRGKLMEQGAKFFKRLVNLDIPKIAVENPIMHFMAKLIIGREQSQLLQPYDFDEPEKKAICLWLKNLPPLTPTIRRDDRDQKKYYAPSACNIARSKERSRFFPGIAHAMAAQWGGLNAPEVDMSFLDKLASRDGQILMESI